MKSLVGNLHPRQVKLQPLPGRIDPALKNVDKLGQWLGPVFGGTELGCSAHRRNTTRVESVNVSIF